MMCHFCQKWNNNLLAKTALLVMSVMKVGGVRFISVSILGHSVAVVTVNLTRCSSTVLPCGSAVIASSNRPDIRWFRNGIEVDNITAEVSIRKIVKLFFL